MLATVSVAGVGSLTPSDISHIKQICHALAGADSSPQHSDPILARLTPYAHDPMTIPGLHVVCDKRCGGLLQLRDDADIYFSYPAAEHSRIDTVVLRHHGKTLLSIGSDGGR